MSLREKAREMFPYQSQDHKAWAKRILWRLEHGDKTLSSVQISFAKEAMNVAENEAAQVRS